MTIQKKPASIWERRPKVLKYVAAVVLGTATGSIILSAANAQDAKPAPLECKTGRITKSFGGTDWQVSSCNDRRSLVIISATGSPAMPFVFFYLWSDDGYRLRGEGNGDKDFTKAALEELQLLTDQDIMALIEETKRQMNR